MTQFELFCLVFYALDSVWEISHNDNLALFLSDINPFLWTDIGSAVPSAYIEFCEQIPQKEIPIEESHKIASEYIKNFKDYYVKDVQEAFSSISEEQWLKGAREYLSQPHKK